MKRMLGMMAVAAVVLSPAWCMQAQAAGGKKAKDAQAQPLATEMTVTGKVSQVEHTNKAGKSTTGYVLTDAAGAVTVLPGEHAGHGRKGQTDAVVPPAVNLAEYVGKDVAVIGKGVEMDRKGKKSVHLTEITKIELVSAPAAAPGLAAAPAPAPAAAAVPAAK